MTARAPPSEDCAPKKLTGSGLPECKSRPKLVFATGIFVVFVDWHRISWHFWNENLFFFEITCFRPEKTFEFLISVGKSLWIFGLHLVHLIQIGINFSCPSPIHINKLLVPPKIYFCPPPSPPPSHAIQAPGLVQQYTRTIVITNNINMDDQQARHSQFKFLPTNLNVQGWPKKIAPLDKVP